MKIVSITFLIPGYLPPDQSRNPDTLEPGSGASAAIAWESGHLQQPWQAEFEMYWGIVESAGKRLPMAKLMGAELSRNAGIVCADPVHLQLDRDTAKLLPTEMLDLCEKDAQSLLRDINLFLRADNMELICRQGNGWCLCGMDASQLDSYPPSFLANRNASAFLPAGDESKQWRRLMTELQMFLHAHPVNEQREQSGKLPVNSLWFWGGGALYSSLISATAGRENTLNTRSATVYADDEFARAACADMQIPCKSLAEFDPLVCEEALVVDTRISSAIFARNESEMHRVIEQINCQWLDPLSRRVSQEDTLSFSIVNEDGDKGVLTSAMQRERSRSDNFLLRGLHYGNLLGQLKRWLNEKIRVK